MSTILIITGSAIFTFLGSLHLAYTFFTRKFYPRGGTTLEQMKNTTPRISSQTTMWKTWIGFNGSHSLGAIYFGVINILLAVNFKDLLQEHWEIGIFNILICLSYLALAVKYWFRTPLIGILIATLCFLASFIIQRFS